MIGGGPTFALFAKVGTKLWTRPEDVNPRGCEP